MTKSKVQIKNLDKVFRAVEKLFDSALKREQFLIKIRDFAVQRIRAETLKGKDLSRNGKPQPELADFTKIIRANIDSGKWRMTPPKSRKFFRVDLSNLTLSGQMLDSLVGYLRPRLGAVEITVEGNREPIEIVVAKTGKPVNFKNKREFATNKGLVSDLARRNRTFLGMDRRGVERIRRLVLDEIRRKIKSSKFIAKP